MDYLGMQAAVELVDGYSKVRVTVKVARSAAGIMVEDTKFWVVAPRFALTGISGIGTLLSGNYIAVQAGESKESARKFRIRTAVRSRSENPASLLSPVVWPTPSCAAIFTITPTATKARYPHAYPGEFRGNRLRANIPAEFNTR